MAQDNLLYLKCEKCGSRNYYTYKNKKKLSQHKLALKKHCGKCKIHTSHKEGKIKK